MKILSWAQWPLAAQQILCAVFLESLFAGKKIDFNEPQNIHAMLSTTPIIAKN